MDVVLAGDYFIPIMKVALAIMKEVQDQLILIEDTVEIVEYVRSVPSKYSSEQQHQLLDEAFKGQWMQK